MTSDGEKAASAESATVETVAEALQRATVELKQRGTTRSARLDAEVLLAHSAQWSRTQLHCRIMDPLSESVKVRFWKLCGERAKGVPIAYLLGWKEFYSRRFAVSAGVLVPRPETELLVERSLQILQRSPGATNILDLCCGSGCIAITLALETLSKRIVAADLSDDALRVCKANIDHFGVGEVVEVVKSDLFSELPKEAFDLIVSNPPYVGTDFGPEADPDVMAHEPGMALFSGRHGTDHLESIVERAPAHLIEGGSLILECASFQAEKIEAWMAERGFSQTCLWHDLSGLPRGVSGRWEG